jgi:exodeoxyribonuclease V alpha subunit
LASDAPILVITGGPGCGKTTVLKYIVKLWCAQGKMVHICAPTGRAAQRIGAIQNVEPSTIHRLLKYRPKNSSEAQSGMSLESLDEDEIDWGEMD